VPSFQRPDAQNEVAIQLLPVSFRRFPPPCTRQISPGLALLAVAVAIPAMLDLPRPPVACAAPVAGRTSSRGAGATSQLPMKLTTYNGSIRIRCRRAAPGISARDQRKEQGAADIGADDERTPPHAIDPHPGEQADEQARRVRGGGQEPHRRRRGMEDEDRREG
jgi:hypothetical protein